MYKTQLNFPVDVRRIQSLVVDQSDLQLMMPTADVPFNPIQWSAKLDPSQNVLSVFARDDLGDVGHFSLMRINPALSEAWLGLVYLHPRARGSGKSSELLSTAEFWAQNGLGLKKLFLNVLISNSSAHRLYCRGGYVEFERTENMIRMEKSLI